ncbi:MAG: hypothetical protein A2521_10415 [Deltaproteobacteria bacterium RIFOXYD12_FULL_57_12]|nr:MAG: hypothetical protein A2521_10415 [Deltaproteobacteria bacterium RIFOXYD12_FULL_57_12]
MITRILLLTFIVLSSVMTAGQVAAEPAEPAGKTARLTEETPAPLRFVTRGTELVDLAGNAPVFFRGIGYSPYLSGETPIHGAGPGDDGRYAEHFALFRELGVNYLHVFPRLMPPGFFRALDKTDLVYGQDVWVESRVEDYLDENYQASTFNQIKEVIDHTYAVGRPERLVLFSIGDELLAEAVTRTDARHPDVHDYQGKHVVVTGRTPTEVALARLIDRAMDYELTRYGRRHLYTHTSWTHIGPLENRPDLDVGRDNVLVPDMGDLICLNIYTYARGVRTSPPGSVTGTAYQGYLEELAAGTTKPILITQVGLSTSPFEPKPLVPGFGGHRVEDVPTTFRAVWKDTRSARGHEKYCGLVFFELQDEWWKSHKSPAEATRQDRDDPEQWFGIYALGKDNTLVPKGDIPRTVRTIFHEP